MSNGTNWLIGYLNAIVNAGDAQAADLSLGKRVVATVGVVSAGAGGGNKPTGNP